jgi:hypothetical protein
MHAIQTGNVKTKATEDLARAVQPVPFERWQEAWALARALQAERRFATALRVYTPGGPALADQLMPRGVCSSWSWFTPSSGRGHPLGSQS